jgi:micrococcal nuclease
VAACIVLLGFVIAAWSVLGQAAEVRVYRWQDAAGEVHFGDRAPDGAQYLALRFDAPERFLAVDYVPDGDTLFLSNGDKVRLLGINTPEVAHRERPGEPGGIEARAFLRALLEGKRVRLEQDQEPKDKYGRILAHVFLRDGTLVNAEVLRAGQGFSIPHPPNLKYLSRYRRAEARAREAGLGVWALPSYGIRLAAEAERHINRFVRLEGRVEGVRRTRSATYLNLDGELEVYYRRRADALFKAALGDPEDLRGKTLVVRGWVRKRRRGPVLHLRHPADIEQVSAL